MKFTAIALLPWALLTLVGMLNSQGDHTIARSAGYALSWGGLSFLTVCVIGLYWCGRIWRAATRDRRPN